MKFLVSLFTTMSSSTCFSHCRWYSGSLSTPHENCTVLPTCTVWLCGPSVIMGGCTGRTAHTLSLCVSSRQPAATYWHWSFQQPSDRQHNLTLHKQLCTCRGSIQHAMWFRNLMTIAKLYKNPIWKGCNGWMTFKVPFYRHYMLVFFLLVFHCNSILYSFQDINTHLPSEIRVTELLLTWSYVQAF